MTIIIAVGAYLLGTATGHVVVPFVVTKVKAFYASATKAKA